MRPSATAVSDRTRESDRARESDQPQRARQDSQRGDPQPKELLEVLRNERRRHILACLDAHEGGTLDLETLVAEVAALETGADPDRLDAAERTSVSVELRRSHLPKMERCGLVVFDADSDRVALGPAADQARRYLALVERDAFPWPYCYVTLSLVLLALTGFAWAGLSPVGDVGGLALAAVAVTAFGVTAVVHTAAATRRRREWRALRAEL